MTAAKPRVQNVIQRHGRRGPQYDARETPETRPHDGACTLVPGRARIRNVDLTSAQAQFEPEPGWLNTASYGLPPTSAWTELQTALGTWRRGVLPWEMTGDSTARARSAFARIVGVPEHDVTIGAQVSQLLGPMAAALPEGSTVLVPQEEFTSMLFPWLAQSMRQVDVRTVPAAELAKHITDDVDMVAFSLVQSASGEVADADAIVAAAAETGAMTVVDLTQAAGWLPLDASRFDATVTGAYKWLLSPRGSAFMTTTPGLRDRLTPNQAGWFAGEDVHSSYYGPPLRLARDARRLDISPAWFSWVGTAPALELIEQVGVETIYQHDLALANRFRGALGHETGDSAIVSIDVAPDAAERLDTAGVRTAVRDGRVRASFHLYTTDDDVDLALEVLTR